MFNLIIINWYGFKSLPTYICYLQATNFTTKTKFLSLKFLLTASLSRLVWDGGCSSVVEHWFVVPVVAGSIPVVRPIKFRKNISTASSNLLIRQQK